LDETRRFAEKALVPSDLRLFASFTPDFGIGPDDV
jgi:hypothetical protein